MTDQMKKFLEYVSANEEIREKGNALKEKCSDRDGLIREMIAFAGENGFHLTEEDFKEENKELCAEELAGVAGGSDCYCLVGGGGAASYNEKTCACVVGGGGLMENDDTRCWCALSGNGGDKKTNLFN